MGRPKYWQIILICCLMLAAVLLVFRNSESLNLDFISASPPDKLCIGVVQMDPRPTLEENRDYIIERISEAAKKNVRVVVFPEGALRGTGAEDPDKVDEAVAAIRKAAAGSRLYVLFDGFTYSRELKKNTNWMLVIDPSGDQLFRYDKLYNNHHAPMPGVFLIDDIPCSAIICADRWLRGVEEIPIQEGAKISFELSNNYGEEWVDPLQWYWYVPRALRNNVWVVLANSGNRAGKFSDSSSASVRANHGHSAIIAPDGSFPDRAADDKETMLVADIDVSQATRAEALARSGHPALRQFWEAGLKLQGFFHPPSI